MTTKAELKELSTMLWRAAKYVRRLPEQQVLVGKRTNRQWALGLARAAGEAARLAR